MDQDAKRFTLCVKNGNVFARDTADQWVRLGKLGQDERGKYNFRLDGDIAGYGYASPSDALNGLVHRVGLPYLTAQFEQPHKRPAKPPVHVDLSTEVTLR